MELIFIRHGQGVHNTDIPDRLNIENPSLTHKGKEQVGNLNQILSFRDEDMFIASPTIRTIETTNIITKGLLSPKKYISPLVGPRMFPLPQNPETYVYRCDLNYPIDIIEKQHNDFVLEKDDLTLWTDGINTLAENEFNQLGQRMIDRIRNSDCERVFIISHDGTITSYRKLLGEEGLTRADFLGEAGWYQTTL
jgi:broad specificity phosphatase PhoE